MGSLEWTGKSPSKMGAPQPWNTPTALSWLTSTPLHCTLLRQGRGEGVTAAMKETLVSAHWHLSGDAEALPIDHLQMKLLHKRLMGNFRKEGSRWPYLHPSGLTWWNLASLRVGQPDKCFLVWCTSKSTASSITYSCQKMFNLNWINPVYLTSSL